MCFSTTFTRVAARTVISEPPADSSVIISTTAYLHCGVSHDPNIPIIIDWLFSGNKIEFDSRYIHLSITIQRYFRVGWGDSDPPGCDTKVAFGCGGIILRGSDLPHSTLLSSSSR